MDSNKEPEYIAISGVCGVGKSSVITHLKKLLPTDGYDIRDFDERGVPDGGGLEWHNNETIRFLDIATENAKRGKSTIVCGFAQLSRLNPLHKEEHPKAKLLLLHASADTIRRRLAGRYLTPESIIDLKRSSGVSLEQFIEDNAAHTSELKSVFEKDQLPIIDTETLSSEEVAKEIITVLALT